MSENILQPIYHNDLQTNPIPIKINSVISINITDILSEDVFVFINNTL